MSCGWNPANHDCDVYLINVSTDLLKGVCPIKKLYEHVVLFLVQVSDFENTLCSKTLCILMNNLRILYFHKT